MISSTTSPWFNASRGYWEQRMHFSESPCGTYAEIRKKILIDIYIPRPWSSSGGIGRIEARSG
ncbi:hypothetical protein CBM2623_A270062 [Cupriavidus taiwanensis]|nr:hypothetical protein CBM2608_A280063 [Cupriavidus taiwanensis]SPA28267.1 hypothetical protein CBM2623_A270062 [Cupriavidus taiwanensis]